MDKYSELQSQAFQYHIERDELEESHKAKVTQLENELRRCKALITELQESSSAMITDVDSTALVCYKNNIKKKGGGKEDKKKEKKKRKTRQGSCGRYPNGN
jgi:hypothetical protein